MLHVIEKGARYAKYFLPTKYKLHILDLVCNSINIRSGKTATLEQTRG